MKGKSILAEFELKTCDKDDTEVVVVGGGGVSGIENGEDKFKRSILDLEIVFRIKVQKYNHFEASLT